MVIDLPHGIHTLTSGLLIAAVKGTPVTCHTESIHQEALGQQTRSINTERVVHEVMLKPGLRADPGPALSSGWFPTPMSYYNFTKIFPCISSSTVVLLFFIY